MGHMVNNVNTLDLVTIALGGSLALLACIGIGYALGKKNTRASASEPNSFPDLVAEVLELMGSVGLVVDRSSRVVGTNNKVKTNFKRSWICDASKWSNLLS